MPIQINEIVIRAVVSDEKKNEASEENKKGSNEEIIAECVEQVMEILKEKEER